MALSSGPLEASVLVTIEASGSGTVVVPGEDPCRGAGRLEEGGEERTKVGSHTQRVSSSGAREHENTERRIWLVWLEPPPLCPNSEMLHEGLLCIPFRICKVGLGQPLQQ